MASWAGPILRVREVRRGDGDTVKLYEGICKDYIQKLRKENLQSAWGDRIRVGRGKEGQILNQSWCQKPESGLVTTGVDRSRHPSISNISML